jgi:hypothetical protein
MQFVIYTRLQTQSRRAFLRVKTRYGRPYDYRPRGDLLERLSRELGWSKEQVLDKIVEEREFLLRTLLSEGD